MGGFKPSTLYAHAVRASPPRHPLGKHFRGKFLSKKRNSCTLQCPSIIDESGIASPLRPDCSDPARSVATANLGLHLLSIHCPKLAAISYNRSP
jgi:hypothetical protein